MGPIDELTRMLLEYFELTWNKVKENYPDSVTNEIYHKCIDNLVYGYIRSKVTANHYHGLHHIIHCLDMVAIIPKDELINPLAVELAIWYHDVCYDCRYKDGANEHNSANVAFDCLSPISESLATDVAELIASTDYSATLLEVPDNDDEAYLRDIDFSGFGLSLGTVLKAGKDIRAESYFVDADTFKNNRLKFLVLMVDPEFEIFKTTMFCDLFEKSAKANIAAEINLIKEGELY